MRDLLSVREAAELLSVSTSWLNKARLTGGGPPFVRVTPRRVAYSRDDLERYVDARRASSTSTPRAAGAGR